MTSCHVFDPLRVTLRDTAQAHLGPAGGPGNARGGIVQPSHAALTLLDQLNHAVERVNGSTGQGRQL